MHRCNNQRWLRCKGHAILGAGEIKRFRASGHEFLCGSAAQNCVVRPSAVFADFRMLISLECRGEQKSDTLGVARLCRIGQVRQLVSDWGGACCASTMSH